VSGDPSIDATPASELDYEALLGALPDAVAVLGPDGTVTWANEQCARLLGLPLADLIGSDGIGRVHPDELPRALDGIAWAAAFPDRTAVVPYRLRREDGTYVDTELKSTVVPTAIGDCLVMMVRDGTTRTTLSAALASVAEGRPVAETAAWIVDAVESRWPRTLAAVVHDDGGRRAVTARSLPDELRSPLAVRPEPARPASRPPWDRADPDGGVIVAEGDDLPDDLRAAALAHGFRACAVVAAPDPYGSPAHVVAWFDEPAAAGFEWPHWAGEIGRLLALALDRRAHQHDLLERSRRDALTGLATRLAFVEQSNEIVRTARRRGHLVGLLYVDLDGFKLVNDRHGHTVGDRVLATIAGRLAAALGDRLVARLGGDEFVVVAVADDHLALDELAHRIRRSVSEPVAVAGENSTEQVEVGASVGVATVGDGDVAEAVAAALDEADRAMYAAKHTRS
jgi:diguanylate cyclase (GGDEF)-like protein/PAS domain S-box-containing protein